MQQKTYVCTSNAVAGGFCNKESLGRFIFDLPDGMAINETSFWSARVAFSASNDTSSLAAGSLWDNPDGTVPPSSEYVAPWRREGIESMNPDHLALRDGDGALNLSPSGILYYKGPIQYLVRKTGYYCVG
jgi:hypothetical protein